MKKLSLVFGHLKENEVDETLNYANLILEVEVLVYVMPYARVNRSKKG